MLPSDILDELMAHNKAATDIEKFVIYGYCADICVINNAMVLLRAAFRKRKSRFSLIAAPGSRPVAPDRARRHAELPVHHRLKFTSTKMPVQRKVLYRRFQFSVSSRIATHFS